MLDKKNSIVKEEKAVLVGLIQKTRQKPRYRNISMSLLFLRNSGSCNREKIYPKITASLIAKLLLAKESWKK
jgi:hypothetical protein